MLLRLVILALIVMTIIGCGSTSTENTDEDLADSGPVATATAVPPTPVPPTPVPPTPEPIGFSGTGDHLSSTFELVQQSFLLLHIDHNGSGNFAIKLLPEEGDGYEFGVDTIGTYEGTLANPINSESDLGLKPGLHRLEVTADGDWNAEIAQHFWTKRDALDRQGPFLIVSGKGDGIVGPVNLIAGILPLKATHKGSGNFEIRIFSTDGKNMTSVVNEVGEYRGQKTIRVKYNPDIGVSDGVNLLVVTADGEWKVEIAEPVPDQGPGSEPKRS